ncbi:GatB/YqeY domain-containing protein [Thioalkalicoccus limnaeus]|uniref:GatB/YqeY domain-containing protein n=1 Tax=Thioalkalicoccus limnaeus TaxID=120681 RepID=A0ABV4BAD8_9GAMM
MIKERIQSDMKAAMKAGDKRRLGVIRLILAAVKQREVDERILLDDAQTLAVLDKMVKQRRDAIAQFEQAKRQDLADAERYEVTICQEYLPEPLGDEALASLIGEVIAAVGASSVKDMGRVMAELRPKVQGRADLGVVSGLVKQRLGES